MKFVSFSSAAIPKPHLGLVQQDEILDVDLAAHALTIIGPDQMQDLIDKYDTWKQLLKSIMDKMAGRRFSEVKTFSSIGAVHTLDDVELAAPIPRPRKNIMCLGLNYTEHAKESAEARGRSASLPDHAVIFTKAPTTANGPFGDIVIDPAVSEEVDWEAELAVIIGKTGKNIREEDAMDFVFGYTVLNDVTARDLQSQHKQYFKGNSIDRYCPMGPWIVTAHE